MNESLQHSLSYLHQVGQDFAKTLPASVIGAFTTSFNQALENVVVHINNQAEALKALTATGDANGSNH